MALKIGNITVESHISNAVDRCLRGDQIFIPGVTYTDDYDDTGAGEILVPVYNPDTELGASIVGSDFTHEDYKQDYVPVQFLNSIKQSKKIPEALNLFSGTSEASANKLIELIDNTKLARDKTITALATLGFTTSNGGAITKANLLETLVAKRAAIRQNGANPNVVLASTPVYNFMLSVAGTDFTPSLNDNIRRTGNVGQYLGMTWVEVPFIGLAGKVLTCIADGGTKNNAQVDKLDFIMYDYRALTALDKLSLLRVIPNPNAAGNLAQMELLLACKVTNPKAGIAQYHA